MSITVRKMLEKVARYNGDNGTCWDDPSNLERLNDARRLIYERVDCDGTMDYGCVPIVKGACLYLPWQLESIRSAWIGSRDIHVTNLFYQTLDRGSEEVASIIAGHCKSISIVMTGVKRPIIHYPSSDFRIVVMTTDDRDDGGVISFKSYNSNAEIVREDIILGEDKSPHYVNDVLSVVKPPTMGALRVFGETRDGAKVLLAEYNADQENPSFTQFKIRNLQTTCRQVIIYGKKRFFDIVNLGDLMDIDSVSAMSLAYQALNAQNGNRTQEYLTYVQLFEEQLEEKDQSNEIPEGFNEVKVSYESAIHPRYDH